MLKRLLWVDPNIADSQCLERLRQCQYVAICAETGAEAIRALKRTTYDLVVLGPRLDVETASLVAEIRRISESIPIALHSPDVPAAGLALDGRFLGVRSVNEIQPRALDRILTSHTQASEPWMNLMVGNSPAMQKVIQLVRLVGPRKATVLITGETGTGKELAARAIHMASGRGALPMVSVNCAALPASLLEAELFGHARGAFTGALTQRIGRFEQAHRGTIFLDEIGEIPLELQAKLLRVLQEREIQRVGSSETIRLDFRVIAASNIDLEEAVRKQRFRQDLLYRLNVAPLHMPRLRDRISDIPVLVDHFLDRICRQEGLPVKQS
ncbi:MAG: sigma-54-dependent Fis family transcriptional regulator, partial [Acidobacteria bacterium]|nr:sigma-54-dependent Fis family transcriptional regulator [Acidobacteriota bacterium]